MQLELFPDLVDYDYELSTIKEKQENLRKGLWRENNVLKKDIRELKADIDFLKAKICKEGMFL